MFGKSFCIPGVSLLQSLVVALVFSMLDYRSATLAGLPKQLLELGRLQCVQNAAEWLMTMFTARRPACTAQPTLASCPRTHLVTVGGAGVSLPASTALHPATWR